MTLDQVFLVVDTFLSEKIQIKEVRDQNRYSAFINLGKIHDI